MIGAFVAIAILLALIAVAGIGVSYFWQRDRAVMSFRSLFSVYFYLVAAISLLALFFGLAGVSKAVMSDIWGRGFSYYDYTVKEMPLEAIESNKELTEEEKEEDKTQHQAYIEAERERIESQYRNDLYGGISMTVVGALFLLVHIWGWRRFDDKRPRSQSFMYRGYVIIQLVIFSLATLVSLPLGLGNLMQYLAEASTSGSNFTPGEPLSFALWATPVWLFFVWLTFKIMGADQKAGS